MAYKAQIKSIEKQKDRSTVQLVAVYTDDQTGDVVERLINMPYGFTLPELKGVMREHIASLESTDQVITKIPLNTDIDLSKNQKEKDREELREVMRDIDELERMVTLNVFTKTEAQAKATELKTRAKALKTSLDN